MPAPVPVRINYGSPTLLSSLAAEAGSAQARRRDSDQAYQMQLQQMAQDSALMRQAISQRGSASRIPQTSPTMLSDAGGYAPRPQTVTNPMGQNDMQRLAMQRQQQHGGLGFMPSGREQQRQLDAERGFQLQKEQIGSPRGGYGSLGVGQRGFGGPATLTERGSGTQFTRYGEGTTVMTGAGAAPGEAQMLREMDPRFAQTQQPQRMPPQVQRQLDMIQTMQGSMPEPEYNALVQGAMSGSLTMDQIMDNARQSRTKPASAGIDYSRRQHSKAKADQILHRGISKLSTEDQAAYAVSMGMYKPEDRPFTAYIGTPEGDAWEKAQTDGALQALAARRNIADEMSTVYGGDMPMTGGQAQASQGQGQADPGYVVGQVNGGRRYVGGPAGDPNSWEVVQ